MSEQKTKKELYEELADKLAPMWERDAWLMEHAQIRWRWSRSADDWLVKHRDDETGVEEYRVKCGHLLRLYQSMDELV
ncbi:MAG: hypothetical protein Q8R07_05490 [Candidatus Uhrbacteria bacterium]|nr:hypothetical protein [Candidatus Uhrbacteria bacterium]